MLDTREGLTPSELEPVDLAREQPFQIGTLRVVPYKMVLENAYSTEQVEPKVMQVLVALAKHPGRIFSRDDLIECCWGGRIVGDASVTRVISLLRAAIRDLGEHEAQIETLPKVGYRLLGNVVAEDVVAGDAAGTPVSDGPADTTAASQRNVSRWRFAMLAVAALAVLAGALGWWLMTRPNVEPLTVVMLPIEAREGVDPLYASGMESEIRSQFGSSVGMEVRGGESAEQLAQQRRSPQEIGEALNTDLVWQGELSTSEESVLLNARLIDSSDGSEVWADEFLAAPDAAQFLPLRATRGMLAALGRPPNPDAGDMNVAADDYALYLTAMGLLKGRGREQRFAAHDILEAVVSRNPRFVDGLAGLAKANFLYPANDRAERDANRAIAFELAEQALERDPRSVDALKVSGLLLENQKVESIARLRLATEIDPGDAEAWFWLSITQRNAAPESGDVLATAVRMVQVDPLWPASWRGSDLAVEEADFELARAMERTIIAASVTRQQRVLAEARLARINGDLSEFIRLSRSVESQLNDAQRRWGVSRQMRMTLFLLNLTDRQEPLREEGLLQIIERGILPPRSELADFGITSDNFFISERIAAESIPLLIQEGRGDELLDYYDTKFASPSAYEAFGENIGAVSQIIPTASPYLVLALRDAGRDTEAEEHMELLRKWVGVWRDSDNNSMAPILYQLNLAALEGDNAAAIALVRRLPDHGWPLQLNYTWVRATGLLEEDPLFDDIRELPEVRAVLAPIRADIARERREALALGLD